MTWTLTMIAVAQLPVLCVLLAAGALAKLWTARGDAEPGALGRLGPAVLVPDRWRAPAMLVCAAGEAALLTGLLASGHAAFRWATAGFFAMSTYVLWELRRQRPDVGCGCFGEVSAAPVGLRSLGRTTVLTAMAAGTVWAPPVSGWSLLTAMTWPDALAAAGGLVVLAALSPEIEEATARIRHRAPCEQRPMPAEQALHRLRTSTVWRAHERLLASGEPVDSWRELCWRFFVYPGRSRTDEPVDVVFAVYLSGRHPAVRMALVDAAGQTVDIGTLTESSPVSARG
ncbi:MauE/DoxX family redox-associated membrane protein [Streptosporangium sp. NPDC048047]|uniref:MauE/DoxX family redox-associated membrane protein n=1 Tax=Streptosporangium sp. NPDC048047 TaxID=3155748 RepID=UPI0034409A61